VKSESKILKSISLDKNDTYYRGLSQIYMAEIQAIISNKTLSADTMKSATQDRITNTESVIGSAIKQNPKYYVNWANAGNVYATLLSLGVTGSYENAVSSFAEALRLSPSNPGIILAQAQLELINKDTEKAKSLIEQALAVKSNYIDAIFTRAQIKYDAGDKSGAIADAELAAKFAPRDTTVFFKLGSLKYNTADYIGAISAFEMAVILDNYNHNARYLLGLSYNKAGRADDAHTQFGILHNIFPDNQEITNAFNGNADVVPAPSVNTGPQTKTTTDKKQTPTLPKQTP
jgi:tetratricopeptide (TPR) repeat protein